METTTYTPPTMSLHECCEALRANNISLSEPKLGLALDDSLVPFGISIRGESDKAKRSVLISRHQFYAWLDDFLGAPGIRV